jgi:alpha-1,4-digalacturonate transport system substrate-binding protein
MGRRSRLLAVLAAGGLIAGLIGLAGAPAAVAGTTVPPDSGVDLSAFAGETLTYVYFSDGSPDEEATRALLDKFTEETGVEVELQLVPFPDLEATLQAQISGGDVPDVARVTNWRPFTDAIVDMNEYFGADYSDQFLSGQVATAVGPNGEFFAVPSDITMNGPFVNVDAFNEAGVEIPTEWTWDELVATAKEVQEANDMEFAFAIDKSGHRVSTVLSQFGTTLLGPDGVTLDAAKAEAAITLLTDLMAEDAMNPDFWLETGSRYADERASFLAGAVPVWMSGNWQVGGLATEATFEWAAVPNPCVERCGGFPGGKYMVAFSGSDNPELAAGFVEWMNRAENQAEIDAGASWLPTRNDLIEQGIEYADRSADMAVFLADVANTPEDTYLTLASPAFDQAATALVEEIAFVVAGEEDVPTAVDHLISRTEQAVEETAS